MDFGKFHSAKLTTFISPFGRYFYRRLPQGITSAPEIFQCTVEEIIAGEEHAVCFFDDILVFSENEEVHECVEIVILNAMCLWLC